MVYDYTQISLDIIDAANVKISDMTPSEWAEKNRILPPDVTSMPGPYRFDNSPYLREILDCLDPRHPARIIGFQKASQVGGSTGLIENALGYIISQHPGNTLFLIGHSTLVKDSVAKVDKMIDYSKLRPLIKDTTQRARNNKSGDTDEEKKFEGGYIRFGITNPKSLRNISMRYGFIDDFDGMESSSKKAGSTQKMIEKRFTAFKHNMKLFYISSPELKKGSNIEKVYLDGDQRKYFVPCPCCGEFIILEWKVESEKVAKETAGITWKLDNKSELIPESVGYICQKCGDFFDDRNKKKLLNDGHWQPTAKPKKPGNYSYHLSALYAPPYMFGWVDFVYDYLSANPPKGERIEKEWQTFQNTILGETYAPSGKSLSANALQKNIRPYEINTVPEKLSIADGNGKIIMLTCGSDLNGTEDDARLDWEIVAHSESGATYSINHGSIGTFIPLDKHPEVRNHSTYRHGATNSVWPEFKKILSDRYMKDTGTSMNVFHTAVDAGYMQNYVYQFVDNYNPRGMVVSVKGDDDLKYISQYMDSKSFRQSRSKANLFHVATNYTKDMLSLDMVLTHNPKINLVQPFGFMNFPTPSAGKYLYENFFSHYEAEQKIMDKNNKYRWMKKTNAHQNHLFDCRLYALIARDIFLDKLFKELKIKDGQWLDYVKLMTRKTG